VITESLLLFAIILLPASTPPQATEVKLVPRTTTFTWSWGTSVLGELEVPSGFTADTWNYKEGILTTLKYRDGSSIVLQKGFMYRIPMFQDSEYILDTSEKESDKTVRRGHYKGKAEVWGEVDYRSPMKAPDPSILGAVGPNLGYEHVPRKLEREFASALLSFRPTR
jgi:hypothetical protein